MLTTDMKAAIVPGNGVTKADRRDEKMKRWIIMVSVLLCTAMMAGLWPGITPEAKAADYPGFAVAGTFNGWADTAMTREENSGTYFCMITQDSAIGISAN